MRPERWLAIHGEIPGHQRGGKWPPMGSIYWPRTPEPAQTTETPARSFREARR
jgi:hypothetical protein